MIGAGILCCNQEPSNLMLRKSLYMFFYMSVDVNGISYDHISHWSMCRLVSFSVIHVQLQSCFCHCHNALFVVRMYNVHVYTCTC